MAYTPPLGDNLLFDLEPYSPPIGSNLEFEFIVGIVVSTLDAINVGFTSARLNGELVNMAGESQVKLWFRYRKIGGLSWIETSPKEVRNAIGTFYRDIAGLEEGTEYEFKSVASKIDDTGEVEGSIRIFNTKGTINLILSETMTLSEIINQNLNLFVEENLSLLESSEIKRILKVISVENLNLLEAMKIAWSLKFTENISLDDSEKFKYITAFVENVSLSDLREVEKDKINHWIITEPENSNFGFELDSDNNGIADGWSYKNISEAEIIKENEKYSIQKIELTGGYFEKVITLNGDYFIHFEIKPTKDIDFEIFENNISKYKYKFKVSDSWIKFSLYFSFGSEVKFRFSKEDYSLFYLDNFAIIKYADVYDFWINKKIAPSLFNYSLEGDEVVNTLTRKEFLKKDTLISHNIEWQSLDYRQEIWLNSLIGKKVFIKTHLDEYFSFLILSVQKQYLDNKVGLEQKYLVRLLIKTI